MANDDRPSDSPPPRGDDDRRDRARQIGILTAVPATLLAGPLLGGLLGKLLDSHFGTRPWGLLVCLALGLAAAGIEVTRLLKLAEQHSDARRDAGTHERGRRGPPPGDHDTHDTGENR